MVQRPEVLLDSARSGIQRPVTSSKYGSTPAAMQAWIPHKKGPRQSLCNLGSVQGRYESLS